MSPTNPTFSQVTDGVDDVEAADINPIYNALTIAGEACNNGWTNPNETWEYLSATSITIPAGGTNFYSAGDRIKITQTTVKYFYVIGVTSTVLTVTGGIDYTVANAAITANYYSKMQSPVGFPNYFNWDSTGGHNVQGGSAVTADNFKFNLTGGLVTCTFNSVVTSNATTMTGTAPIAAAFSCGNVVRIRDNSTTYQAGFAVITAGTITYYPLPLTTTGWTNSGTKGVYFGQLSYNI